MVKAAVDALDTHEQVKMFRFAKKELRRVFLKDFPGAKMGAPIYDGLVQHSDGRDGISFHASLSYVGAVFDLHVILDKARGWMNKGDVKLFCDLRVDGCEFANLSYHRRGDVWPTRKTEPVYSQGKYRGAEVTHSEYLGKIAQRVDDVIALQEVEEEARAEEERRQAAERVAGKKLVDGPRLRKSGLAS